jgi:transposase
MVCQCLVTGAYPSDLTDAQWALIEPVLPAVRRGGRPEVVCKPKDQKGFAVIPRRWAVERTLAWLTAHRRPARDYERAPASSEAMIRWAAISGIARRLTRGRPASR